MEKFTNYKSLLWKAILFNMATFKSEKETTIHKIVNLKLLFVMIVWLFTLEIFYEWSCIENNNYFVELIHIYSNSVWLGPVIVLLFIIDVTFSMNNKI